MFSYSRTSKVKVSTDSWGDSDPETSSQLPRKYKVLKELGRGGFGQVLQCLDKDTDTVVAIKLPQIWGNCKEEVGILQKLMEHKLNQHNIITFHGSFKAAHGDALVFECLGLSLESLMIQNNLKPMELEDIRDITEQLAHALSALKKVDVIHTDIKLDNIMLDKQTGPYTAKLIDFGLAMYKSAAQQGKDLQTVCFRSPEIILGLPFSEAIDMWSLGCVIYTMLTGNLMINHDFEYEAIDTLCHLLGKLPNKLLDQGTYTKSFFTKTKSNTWVIKGSMFAISKGLKMEKYDMYDDCINLMKAMLAMDASKRITPEEVLQHPFITKYRLCPRTTSETNPNEKTINPVDEGTTGAPTIPLLVVEHVCPAEGQGTKVDSNITREETLPSSMDQKQPNPPPTDFPSGVILVKAAKPENTLRLQDEEEPQSQPEDSLEPTAEETPSRTTSETNPNEKTINPVDEGTTGAPTIPLLVVEHVCPAEGQGTKVDSNITREETLPSSMDQKQSNPPPTDFPSGVILVKAAKPENTLRLQDEEEPQSQPEDSLEPTAEEMPSSSHFAKSPSPEVSKEKPKKKNCFQRLWSSLKNMKWKFFFFCM